MSNLKSIIHKDLYRCSHGVVSKKVLIQYLLRNPGFKYMFWLRVNSHYRNKSWFSPINLVSRFLLKRYKYKYGIEIHPTTKIGEGMFINHFGGIVVNENAVIGKNCNLSHGVTIGQTNRGSKQGSPVIGDNVFIGPGAKIIGHIRIGNNAAIGANAVVTSDIPDNGVAVGIPAKVISMKGSVGYVENTEFDDTQLNAL